uniref:Uncharacterized protein n=1 Tax=Strigamia maritima TaxID=126957 RepID=T1IPP6_STRMM
MNQDRPNRLSFALFITIGDVILSFELMLLFILPLRKILVGFLYDCPIIPQLPGLLVVHGVLSLAKTIFLLKGLRIHHQQDQFSNMELLNFLIDVGLYLMLILVMPRNNLTKKPDFVDPTSSQYCNYQLLCSFIWDMLTYLVYHFVLVGAQIFHLFENVTPPPSPVRVQIHFR